MPCDLGYKSFARAEIPVPTPETLKKTVSAPKVDAELMERLGQDDPAFVDWMNGLDGSPLMTVALERALAAADGKGLSFTVNAGGLTVTTTFRNDAQKRKAETQIEKVGRRWQMEVLSIVAQLLDFETQIVADGDTLMLEGEKRGSHAVHEYLRVTADPDGGTTMLFEHFASAEEEAQTRTKFAALGQKLGVRITVNSLRTSGSPIPVGADHRHHLRHSH